VLVYKKDRRQFRMQARLLKGDVGSLMNGYSSVCASFQACGMNPALVRSDARDQRRAGASFVASDHRVSNRHDCRSYGAGEGQEKHGVHAGT
jgi:hypothetical protein